MRSRLWISIVFAAGSAAFLLGYSLSSHTVVEPGYIIGAETGGYGAKAGETTDEGISAEDQEYYKGLMEQ